MSTETKKDEKGLPEDLLESAHRIWLAGLGAVAAAEEEGTKLFQGLVEKGQDLERRGREGVAKVKRDVEGASSRARESVESTFDKVSGGWDDRFSETLKRLGVPTREEISTLTARVEELTRSIERLRGQKG